MGLVGVALSAVFFPLTASVLSGYVALAGLIWAPFGALISARAAHKRGLPVRRYAVAGAALSVLYFAPWLHLVMRMHDRHLPRFVIWCAYFILYVSFWLFGVIGLGLFILTFAFADTSADTIALYDAVRSPGDPELEVWQGPNPTLLVRGIIIAQLVLNAILWVVSLRKLRRMDRHDQYFHPTYDLDPLLPHSAYILPFVYALAGSALMFATAWFGVGIWR